MKLTILSKQIVIKTVATNNTKSLIKDSDML